jgi:4-hydroxybenzoate polyprenyltransferase
MRGGSTMKLVRALISASHPIPSLAVTAMATLLTAEAAPSGFGAGRVVLVALAVLAGQLSVGWSNDAIDGVRDAGRADKPVAVGLISARALWLGAAVAAAASLALAAALGPVSLVIDAAMTAVAWSYNLGLKSTVWSGASYAVAFGLLPSFSASALPGHPLARWPVTVAAALLGLGAHFANVLPDLAEDARNGVRGLPQRLAGRFGPIATRSAALALLLGASVLLVIAASPGRRWAAIVGLCCSGVLAVIGARGRGQVPFLAAIGIAGVNVALFAAGVEALTSVPPATGALG